MFFFLKMNVANRPMEVGIYTSIGTHLSGNMIIQNGKHDVLHQ